MNNEWLEKFLADTERYLELMQEKPDDEEEL